MRRTVLGVVAVAAGLLLGGPALSSPPGTATVPSALETVPTRVAGDTADDAAIWVSSARPGSSLVITNEKQVDRLTVFDLSGKVVQRITDPSRSFGNVDVRGNIVAAAHSGVWVWRVTTTADGPRLVAAREPTGNARTSGEGLCLWDPGARGTAGGLYAVNVNRATFRVRVHPLTDKDGDGLLLVGKPVRDFRLGSEGEGCETDDRTGALYVAEEDVGIWRYDLTAPAGPVPPRTRFASVGPLLAPDVEGLALADDVLYASAQHVADPQDSWFSRYDAATGTYLGSFRVVDGATSDDCDQTDGIDVYPGPLGTSFPHGLFVCQDGFNDPPGTSGSQNFKYVPLDAVTG